MERKDSESSVSALKRQLASVKEKCGKVDLEIDQVKAAIGALRKGSGLASRLRFPLTPQFRTEEGGKGPGESSRPPRARVERS